MIIRRTQPEKNIPKDFIEKDDQDPIVLFIFSAEWSETGHLLMESLLERTKQLAQIIDKVVIVDFDKNKELVEKFNIEVIPTSIVTKNEKECHKFLGLFSFDEMKKVITSK